MAKKRADQLLFDRGLVERRSHAQAMILAGLVYSGERKIEKAGQPMAEDATIELRGRDHPWVSRGGIKRVHAMDHFSLDVHAAVPLDVVISIGSFTYLMMTKI